MFGGGRHVPINALPGEKSEPTFYFPFLSVSTMRLLLLLLLLPMLVASCLDAPEYPVEPVITFKSLNKSEIFTALKGNQIQNQIQDSIKITISFTDGDGDLSNLAGDSIDIFLTDSRLGIQVPFALPDIPIEGTGNGISGDIILDVVNSAGVCCIFRNEPCVADPRMPTDTFSYAIQIRDRAGNLSNSIQTPPITILCQSR